MSLERHVFAAYELGDMTACYTMSADGKPELSLLPSEFALLPEDTEGCATGESIVSGGQDEAGERSVSGGQDEAGERSATGVLPASSKQFQGECLVQAKILEDDGPGAYACGTTMRNGQTVQRMIYDGQEYEEDDSKILIRTRLRDERGLCYIHSLCWPKGSYALESTVRFENNGGQSVSLEMLSSFSLSGITAFAPDDGHERLQLHRIRSRWSAEGRLVTETPEDLQLEPSWSGWSVNSVRYGQVGSMPVKGYFPFGAAEDTLAHVVWAAQLAVESSWQMEFYRRDDDLAFSGGLADREFGHWIRKLEPGESLETPMAILTVVRGDVDEACQRLTWHGKQYLASQPASERQLPVLFNEYCTTWGLPSHRNIHEILQALKGHGIAYFVVDAGWFVEEGKTWGDGMGDYIPSDRLFPQGLGALTQEIRQAGMQPGIWFEIDNVGKDAHVYEQEEMLLHRDGKVLTNGARRFFSMTNPEVNRYLTQKVIGQLKQYGFSYLKMDYNETIGIGCDGADSPGEGLRQDREASVAFVRKIRQEIPEIILENCSSGGHKLEPLMMSLCSMASFSDAHEAAEIPVIALRLHRTILPAQSQIWAVIREHDSLQRIAYTMASTFLGRMCLSGDVTHLSDSQWEKIDEAIAFYRRIVPIIRDGFSYLYEHRGRSDRHLSGWQALVRAKTDEKACKPGQMTCAFALVHHFGGIGQEEIVIDLPAGCPEHITAVYCGTKISARTERGKLIITPDLEMEAIAVILE